MMEDSEVPKDLDGTYDDHNNQLEAAFGDESDQSQDWEAVMDERENRKHDAIQAIIDTTPSEADRSGGFSRERWSFWSEQFGRLRAREGLRQETRDVAEKAFLTMAEIEHEVPAS